MRSDKNYFKITKLHFECKIIPENMDEPVQDAITDYSIPHCSKRNDLCLGRVPEVGGFSLDRIPSLKVNSHGRQQSLHTTSK